MEIWRTGLGSRLGACRATAIARHSTHTMHVSITRYTRSVHILTTRGTVGVDSCVERRETLDVTTVGQCAFGRANP